MRTRLALKRECHNATATHGNARRRIFRDNQTDVPWRIQFDALPGDDRYFPEIRCGLKIIWTRDSFPAERRPEFLKPIVKAVRVQLNYGRAILHCYVLARKEFRDRTGCPPNTRKIGACEVTIVVGIDVAECFARSRPVSGSILHVKKSDDVAEIGYALRGRGAAAGGSSRLAERKCAGVRGVSRDAGAILFQMNGDEASRGR